MAHHEELSRWITTVSTHMPHLSKPQATVLALYSFGMVIAQACGISSIAAVLGRLLRQQDNTVRQRLREFYQGKRNKAGTKRQEIVVTTCFAPLLRWVLTWWAPDERRPYALSYAALERGNPFSGIMQKPTAETERGFPCLS
jgi:hypothetical protein